MKKVILCGLSLFLMINSATFAQTKSTTDKNDKVEVVKKKDNKKGKKEKPVKLLKVGDKCKNYKYEDINGNMVSMSDLRGKYVIIDIWATWCPPCRKETPHFEALKEKMKNNNIHFVAFSSDFANSKEAWKNYVKKHNLTGIQLFRGSNFGLTRAFDVKFIPHFILLDKKGRVINLKLEHTPSQGDNLYNYLMTLKGI